MTVGAKAARRPRVDSQRNRERLIEAAKLAFSDTGPGVSLEEIARRAGVGIGTFYRHFPSRDAIVEAVYRREVEQLASAADHLLASLTPGEALRQWMRLFVDYIATKKVILAAASIVGDKAELYAASGARIATAIGALVERAATAGDIRADVEAKDLLRALMGFIYGAPADAWQASALRLIDLLMDGLRPQR